MLCFTHENLIKTFKLGVGANIANIKCWHTKSDFDFRIRAHLPPERGLRTSKIKVAFCFCSAEYCILAFKTLFCHLNWGRISHFAVWNPILTSKWGRIPKLTFEIRILTLKFGPIIAFRRLMVVVIWSDLSFIKMSLLWKCRNIPTIWKICVKIEFR